MRFANSTLIVSFCNALGAGSPLVAAVRPDGGVQVCVTATPEATSACGIALDADHLYVACSIAGGASQIFVLDKPALEIVDRVAVPHVRDVHSICVDADGALIAASTGTNEVVRFDLTAPDKKEVLWRADTSGADTQHVNAVAWHEGRLFCSAFGRKTADRWYTARNGYAVDVTSGERVWENIYHPHSLVSHGGELFLCESSRSRVISKSGSIVQFDSYTRGLAFGRRGEVFAGSSIGRAQTALPEEVLNPADPGRRAGRCGIHVKSRSGEAGFIDLSNYASEIYDILPLALR